MLSDKLLLKTNNDLCEILLFSNEINYLLLKLNY